MICEKLDLFGKVIEILVSKNLYCIYVVDEIIWLLGVIMLWDIISCFVLELLGFFDGYFGGVFKEVFERLEGYFVLGWSVVGCYCCFLRGNFLFSLVDDFWYLVMVIWLEVNLLFLMKVC